MVAYENEGKENVMKGVLMDCLDESLEEMSYAGPEVNKNGLIFSDFMSGIDNQKERMGKHASPIRNEEQEWALGSLPLWILRAPTGLHLGFIFIWEMSFGQSTREKRAVLTSWANAAKHKVLLISSSLDKLAEILCFISIAITALWTDSLSGFASSQELWFFSFCVYISHITVWKQPTEMTNCSDSYLNISQVWAVPVSPGSACTSTNAKSWMEGGKSFPGSPVSGIPAILTFH